MLTPKFYPNKNNIITFFDNFALPKLINKTTPVSSMGSCFATNIGRYFIENDYNYIIKEPLKKNADPNGLNPYLASSANWNFVYNTSVMRQIFEYSLKDEWSPIERWWELNTNILTDPYRRDVQYKKDLANTLFIQHKNASMEAMLECDVFILTLGLTELWRNKRDKMVFYRVPPVSVYDENKHEFYIQTIDDVIKDLDAIYTLLKKVNNRVNFIITVSPVPFNASFRTDIDQVSANVLSKSTLRIAADLFVRNYKDVFYFPSYEIILNAIIDPFVNDGRHIKPKVVKQMMGMFEKKICKI